MSHAFYPFVEEPPASSEQAPSRETNENPPSSPQPTPGWLPETVAYPTRIAVYDDAAAAPRVVIIDPSDVRSYLEEITREVTQLSHEQGGVIPFMVIREVVENLIHAYFIEPIVSILPGGNTIRFSDQGPGIPNKERALEYGTTTATDEMKRYIRGVGSGLPYVQQYLLDKGGSLLVEDNMGRGTIVTISMGTALSRADLAPEATTPAMPQVAATAQADPLADVSERGRLVLDYLRSHEFVGPSDLKASYGYSPATWSRELAALDAAGLTHKQPSGQKRHLTQVGKSLLG